MIASRTVKLRKLRDPRCSRCDLSHTEGNVCALGRGNVYGRIMILGEAPGAEEARTGKPFCGRSGKWMQEQLRDLDMEDMVYITNGVRCRPPNNRTPKRIERKACKVFLLAEIRIVKPQIIVAVGRSALDALELPKSLWVRGIIKRSQYWNAAVLSTWHPAYCLRSALESAERNEFVNALSDAKEFANDSI